MLTATKSNVQRAKSCCAQLLTFMKSTPDNWFVFNSERLQCFLPGECEDSLLLSQSVTLGENACLHFCQKVEGCEWFTYHTVNSLCVAMSDCVQINSTSSASSGQSGCPDLEKGCQIKGLCQGRLITEVQ